MNENDYDVSKESFLEQMRLNCVMLQEVHKKTYFQLKGYLPLFKVPNIIISSCCSVASVGLSAWIPDQTIISGITCLMSLIAAILTSIEMFLKIEESMVSEERVSRSYYLLASDIYKTLSLTRDSRPISGGDYINQCVSEYSKLIEKSNFVRKKIEDKLLPLPPNLMSDSNSNISFEIGV